MTLAEALARAVAEAEVAGETSLPLDALRALPGLDGELQRAQATAYVRDLERRFPALSHRLRSEQAEARFGIPAEVIRGWRRREREWADRAQ